MEELIKKFDTKCKIVSCVSKNSNEYEVVLRTQVNYTDCDDQCMQWITKFSAATNTQWIVFQNYPNLQRLYYRKDFVCQHSRKNKTRKMESTRERNKDCPAKIIYKVKNTNRFTKYRDPLLKENLNAVIEVGAIKQKLTCPYFQFIPVISTDLFST